MRSQLPTRPPRDRRYGWFRLYNGFPSHPKWELVSAMTCVEKSRVLGIALCLIEAGNKGTPRGEISEFSLLECAVTLRIDPQEVRRVYKTLEELGWVDQAHITTWDERQPDKEDVTNKERQKAFRRRQKEKRKQELKAVTPLQALRNDQTRLDKQEEPAVTPPPVDNIVSGQRLTYEQAESFLKEQRATQRNLPLLGVVGKRGHR